jgi:gluconokinase
VPDLHATAAERVLRIVVMGVSGSGKTTVGELLAERLGVEYRDADSFHTDAARAKMAAGVSLTDRDREPWLDSIGAWLARQANGGVASCSALKREYRDRLRRAVPDLVVLYCEGSHELISKRMAARPHHFMPPSLLASQFADLEPPGEDENAFHADVRQPPEVIVERFLATVASWLRGAGE